MSLSDAYMRRQSIIDPHNGLSPSRHQAIVSTIAGILLIVPLGTNFSGISIAMLSLIQENDFETVVYEMAAILSRPQWC